MSPFVIVSRTIAWGNIWASTDISSTDVVGNARVIFMPSLRISLDTDKNIKVDVSISSNAQGKLNHDDTTALEQRMQLLISKCLNLNSNVECSRLGGSVILSFPAKTDEQLNPYLFSDKALQIAAFIWEIFGLQKYLLKKFTYSSEELVIKNDGNQTVVQLTEWLKENHPLLT